ncbi:NUDIX hydrolase [Candidatus Micrarchaeota archaeon]|nr:NUDIX hydrolase [Candidatus Micrarchaeota archaeon]
MLVFRGKKFSVRVEPVRLPNGKTLMTEGLVKRPGANVIPFVDKDTILLAYQYRPVVKKWIYQLCGGKIEKDETPIENARKELEEELGYTAGRMRLIAKFYTAPHMSNDFQYIFVATKLKKSWKALEEHEVIKTKRLKLSTALKMIRSGEITDATTIAGLLMLRGL